MLFLPPSIRSPLAKLFTREVPAHSVTPTYREPRRTESRDDVYASPSSLSASSFKIEPNQSSLKSVFSSFSKGIRKFSLSGRTLVNSNPASRKPTIGSIFGKSSRVEQVLLSSYNRSETSVIDIVASKPSPAALKTMSRESSVKFTTPRSSIDTVTSLSVPVPLLFSTAVKQHPSQLSQSQSIENAKENKNHVLAILHAAPRRITRTVSHSNLETQAKPLSLPRVRSLGDLGGEIAKRNSFGVYNPYLEKMRSPEISVWNGSSNSLSGESTPQLQYSPYSSTVSSEVPTPTTSQLSLPLPEETRSSSLRLSDFGLGNSSPSLRPLSIQGVESESGHSPRHSASSALSLGEALHERFFPGSTIEELADKFPGTPSFLPISSQSKQKNRGSRISIGEALQQIFHSTKEQKRSSRLSAGEVLEQIQQSY